MKTSEARLNPQDAQAVRSMMTRLQADWRARDFDAYLAHYAADADIINRTGAWFRGREAFAQQLKWLFANGYPEMFQPTTLLESVRELAPGVFVVVEHRDEGPRQSLASYVVVLQGQRWVVQSVSIAPIEPSPGQRGAPGR